MSGSQEGCSSAGSPHLQPALAVVGSGARVWLSSGAYKSSCVQGGKNPVVNNTYLQIFRGQILKLS